MTRAPIPVVVHQHVEEAAHLRHVRSVLVRAPHVRLLQLGRLDERIAAHLDGIAVAGDYGVHLCRQALEDPGKGQVFAATVGALLNRDPRRLDALLAIAEALPESRCGLLSAFGWVSATDLRGITQPLLEAHDPWRREVGLSACALHGVDPRGALDAALVDPDPGLRARALGIAGRLGRVDLRQACLASLTDSDPACAFHAAASALLLGDRYAALDALESIAAQPGPRRLAALCLALKALDATRSRALLARLSKEPLSSRTLIQAIGIAGDAHFVPWLIGKMDDPLLTRLAGEAFSLMTGLDLAYLDLELKPPETVLAGPNDDPMDAEVAMDEDDSLPWPDTKKIAEWWQAKGPRFAAGRCSFMGEAPSPAHCLAVLTTSGFQRQRSHAAQHLVLLRPGTPLFNIAAPTWRQKRLLSRMSP